MASIPQKQKQVQVTKFSQLPKLEGLEVVEGDVPSPKDGEVLCQILLSPVNPTDVSPALWDVQGRHAIRFCATFLRFLRYTLFKVRDQSVHITLRT